MPEEKSGDHPPEIMTEKFMTINILVFEKAYFSVGQKPTDTAKNDHYKKVDEVVETRKTSHIL